jgi:putative ABC transport system substrate-binding protein
MLNRPYFIIPCFKILSFLLSFSLLIGCASMASKRTASNSHYSNNQQIAKETKKILVINSNQSIERYQIAESVFVASLDEYHTSVVNLEKENQPAEYLQDLLNQGVYDLVYCIGAKALGSIDYIDPGLPVVYTSVLNWRKFEGRKNYFGISSELSPQVQLTWIKYFFPELTKIGVFYSEENQAVIDDSMAASKNLSLNLKPLKLDSEDQRLLSAEKFLSEIDALWLISDSSTISSIENVNILFHLAEKLSIPVVTYNPLFMDIGAIMSLAADLPTTARQAALITKKLLEAGMSEQAIQYPAGSSIILSGQKLKQYKIKLNPSVLDSVDELRD